TDFGGKTSIFSHSVYLFIREFSLQDFRGGSLNYVDRKVLNLDASVLFDMPSPTMHILNELRTMGYNVDAAVAEFNAFKHLTEEMRRTLLDISRTSEKSSRFGFNVNL
ncbi:hypothetical protein, partial [Escherichia coli]|uniref:hypothetical protein n=1 Tax=Escherichia coli TaxID=562 RepID=UPI0021AE8D4A